ncbi:hypothetical protein MVEN_00865600 [Mycena venus]|uniref:Mid2 domain-containing protein n=1 Tax=Mycena venus TaxID=2733690 RepID=A0A8H6YFE9_9AGAR|nr:hypothetical protein MVEN_00865600 [Mycena venus]
MATSVILWFCTPGILPMTITGPSSAQSNSIVTFTWTSVSGDPTIFEIDSDEALNSLNQSDPYWIVNNLAPTHRIAFSSNDGFQILAEGSIEILAASSSSIPSSSAPDSSTGVPVPVSRSPVPSTGSFTSPTSSITPTLSSSQSSPTQPQTATSRAQISVSSDQISPSPAATSFISESSTQPQTSNIGPQNSVPSESTVAKHHSNASAIAGGVVGGAVMILLALLGWWYFHRRSSSAAAGESQSDILARPQFLAAPISTALTGAREVYNGSNNHEFRPWEDNETSAVSSAATPALATSDVSNRKQPIFMYHDPPAVDTTQPHHGPSREELLEEVQRLREQLGAISPPSYSGE